MPVTPAISQRAMLTCNAEAPRQTIHGIDANVSCDEGNVLRLTYLLVAITEQLRIPTRATPRRVDGLWQHSCFEAFIRASASPEYYEFNFSPSGEWAAYAFRGYRDGGPLDDDHLDPAISVKIEKDCLELVAVIRLNQLPLIQPAAVLRVGLSAVIEETDGRLSYWALKHPAEKPDFHHADSFALELALPERSA